VALSGEISGQHPLVPIRVLLAQSGPRADDAVEKLVELGVAEISPLLASGRRREARTDRWQRIAEGAAAQAKLVMIPTISAPVAYRDALVPGAIVCSHEHDDSSLADALAGLATPITLLIGPEAGFSDEELGAARQAGVPIVRFGQTVLRTETAAVVFAALVIDRLSSV
jgi:16S rRNA (uracil1498-N3)-methyltransferase